MFSTTFAPPRVLSSRGFAKSSLPSRMLAKSRTEQPRSSAICINLELWIPRLKVARDLKNTWLKFGLYTVQHATWHLKLLKCCTVYRPNFNQVFFKSLATFSLGIHNSRLMHIAEDLGCSVLDLANILEGKEDFANPLELSTRGGAKVVENITNFVNEHPSRLRFETRAA